jgi:NAD(P)-dependent dehydrogenase (short-subunit alcohol dehydrogenase family)
VSPSAQAVVVGATGEVGAAIVVRLRKAGVPVVAVARDRDRLEQLSATDDGITACVPDIGDDSSGEAIAAACPGPSGWWSSQQLYRRPERWVRLVVSVAQQTVIALGLDEAVPTGHQRRKLSDEKRRAAIAPA